MKPLVITVANINGGVGKTTVVLNLAYQMNVDYVIELDLNGSFTALNNLRSMNNAKPFNSFSPSDENELIQFILGAKKLGKSIIIDCGGSDADVNRIAIASADIVITPTNEDAIDLNALRVFNQVLEDISNKNDKKINAFVFANRVHHSKFKFRKLEEWTTHFNHLSLMKSKISQSKKAISTAADKGLTCLEFNKNHTSSIEFKSLGKEILTLINSK